MKVTCQLRLYQEQSPWTRALLSEDGRVRGADLGTPGEHGEFRGCGEGGGQLHEVTSAEVLFGLGADEQHAAVAVEEALGDQV